MPTTTIANWFEEAELPIPEDAFSIRDTVGDIKQSPEGAKLIAEVMEILSVSRGEVGRGVKIPSGMQAITERLTLEKLLKQAGGVSIDQVAEFNARLNLIAK